MFVHGVQVMVDKFHGGPVFFVVPRKVAIVVAIRQLGASFTYKACGLT